MSTFKINSCSISSTPQRFLEYDEVPSVPVFNHEDTISENQFQSTLLLTSGRYQVRLRFNDKKAELGESRDHAFRRLPSFERRFVREPQYKEACAKFMQRCEDLGHIVKVIRPSSSKQHPH